MKNAFYSFNKHEHSSLKLITIRKKCLLDAEKLANYLLKNDTAWTAQKISVAMHLGKEQFVIKKSETVFVVYFTALVDLQGQLNFRKDLYERDKHLAAILLENAAQ